MLNLVKRYTRWLHTQWPAGTVEKLPEVNEHGLSNVPGLYVVGDLTGIPLLKFSSDSGARAVRHILDDGGFKKRQAEADVLDIAIIGAGVSGVAAAAEARSAGLTCELLEATEAFSTVVNFPKGKPIYTYPTDMTPAGDLQFTEKSSVKEGLVEEMRAFMNAHGIEPRQVRVERVRRTGGRMEVHLQGGEVLRAHRVIVAIGRSGNYRKLGVPGEDLDKVYNRLHDPKDFCGGKIAVVGGGDSALETAIALATCGSAVTLIYRKPEFSRPKPDNIERIQALVADPAADVTLENPSSGRVSTAAGAWMGKPPQPGRLKLMMSSSPTAVREDAIDVKDGEGNVHTLENDVVFSMIGREAPLDFFRRSGVHIRGEWRPMTWVSCSAFVLFCVFLYHWKSSSGIPVKKWFEARGWFPFNVGNPDQVTSLAGTINLSMQNPSFYYSLAYCICVFAFGLRRIRRRRTPYVTAQTATLIAVQWIPLFILPYILLPWLGHNGTFGTRHEVVPVPEPQSRAVSAAVADLPDGPLSDAVASTALHQVLPGDASEWSAAQFEKSWGNRVLVAVAGADGHIARSATVRLNEHRIHLETQSQETCWFADSFFPASEWSAHGREYWRSVGFILAWPLLPWNVFSSQPMWGWLILAFVQTFVIIPLIIRKWGKGAYCGWICSCGALAETMGDAHRHKMPHGPFWNRVNMIGQVFLAFAAVLLVLRLVSWATPGGGLVDEAFAILFEGKRANGAQVGGIMSFLNYAWFVDLLWAGILGVCFYFWFSGRVWCRFACPLAALMHIYARFTRFRIAADKKKCISCNVCTSVCHQGIDVMNFANKGRHMADPECVRCSACVQSCPTGVLEFVQINVATEEITHRDRLAASPVRLAEQR